MDRMVDHLFAFEGDGVIRDYPGNYTQYRAYLKDNEGKKEESKYTALSGVTKAEPKTVVVNENATAPRKLSFKEKQELENLDKEIPALQKEKQTLELKMSESLPYEELQKAGDRVSEIIALLDAKEMRWLELSE